MDSLPAHEMLPPLVLEVIEAAGFVTGVAFPYDSPDLALTIEQAFRCLKVAIPLT